MSPSVRQFRLPDLLSACPLKDGTSPHYKEAAAESRAWINSYDIFTDRKRAFFIQGQNELLCSHVYCFAGYEELRTTCDFVNLLFVVDEVSDEQNGMEARATGQVFVNAMKYGDWDDGSILATITKEFRARFLRLAGPNTVKRFADQCETYTQCVGREAELRERNEVLGVQDFVPHRRQNSAVLLCFTLVEYILGLNLKDEVYEDETFQEAYFAACDYVCWSNDVYSYDMEQSRGLIGNNIVTVLMNERGISLQEASDYIGAYCDGLLKRYLNARKRISLSLGLEAAQFIDAVGQWMIGNLVWSFETVRYFGPSHLEVKETGIVYLRPQARFDDSGSESSDDEC
ncbi:isoprenoid synthase domain-containing protein [Crepidotus variabilis]|uniref:Terpene synthase n=1 Tax=Crepidotus variabilis TaxID=179855 RepID=A0A9P6EML9_9AGAR|nr:isoprenoid synthase domain-containing protein [Crepidotus variabilis]